MIIRFFKSNQPISIFVVPLFAILLWVSGFVNPQDIQISNITPLYSLLFKGLSNLKFVNTCLALSLLIAEAFIINYIINEHEILGKQSYMPALLYVLLMSAFPSMLTLHPGLLANLFLLLALHQLFNTYRKEVAFSQVFNAGFFVALASLFYFPAILLFLLVWVALIVFRPFIWREWIIAILGLLVPYMYLGVYYFWIDAPGFVWPSRIFNVDTIAVSWMHKSISFYILTILLAFIGIFSIGKQFTGLTVNKLKAKNSLILLAWFFVFSLLMLFIIPVFSMKYFSFLALPLSVFCSNYFLVTKKSWWAEVLFISLLIAIIWNQFA